MRKHNDLVPCPFCGGEAILKSFKNNDPYSFIVCENCHIMTPSGTTERVKFVWNRRANKIPVGNGENYEVIRND